MKKVSLETALARFNEIEAMRRVVFDYGDEDIIFSTLWCGVPDGASYGEMLDYLLDDEDDETYNEWLRVYTRALNDIAKEEGR